VRILLVEDDAALAESLSRALKSQGWAVDWLLRGEPVASAVQRDPPDLMILDIGLSGMDGFETLRRLRDQGAELPVIMLTARDAVEDRVRGLETGADDYLVKPFALVELIARINVLRRRRSKQPDGALELGQLRMDLAAKRVFVGREPLDVSVREWDILRFLLGRLDMVVSKEQILEVLQRHDAEPITLNAIEVYVSRLRAKLQKAGIRIRAVRGFGYLLEGDTDTKREETH
jgi:two-component system, OmpR family, response regulator